MNGYARSFQAVVWIGIVINFILAAAALFAPDWMLRTMGFDVAYPNLWPRFAAWLLILLSLFYIPGANDLNRYRANAVLSVCARFAGVAFFAGAVVLIGFSTRYLLFGLIDLAIGLPSSVLLWMAVRRQKADRDSLSPETRTTGASHAVAEEEVAHTR